jgi:glycosyltransferase involved in cell wall biosynthesis
VPKISVIIPLLNKGLFIGRALKSVFSQTNQDFDVIVVDGGSVDNGPLIVREWGDSRIRFFQQDGKGISRARNQGVNVAEAGLIAFLDADDEWRPNHLKEILKLHEKYPDAGAYTTAYKIVEESGKLRWARYHAIPPPPWEGTIANYFHSAALGEFPVWSSAVCIPKKVFIEMGGFKEDAWWGEDADLFGRIALKYPIAFSWEWGAIYHWDASNRVCGRPSLEPEPFVTFARNELKNNRVSDFFSTDLEEYVARKEIYRAASHLYIGNNLESRNILRNTQTRVFKTRKNLLLLLSILPVFFNRVALRGYFSS